MKRKMTGFVAAALVITCISMFPDGYLRQALCRHEQTYSSVSEPTCIKPGWETKICADCAAALDFRPLKATGHVYGEFEVFLMPSAEENGLKVHSCIVCGAEETLEYACPHDTSGIFVIQEPTCEQVGVEAAICEACGKAVDSWPLERLECSYGDWIYTKWATPFEMGIRYKRCSACYKSFRESYEMTMPGENSIYIPGTGICASFHIGSFTQEDVDHNDILYTEMAYANWDPNNPFVLGHNTGTMKDLSKTKLGQNIYLSLNGTVEIYEVVVSEYALLSSNEINIYGQTTGTNIWDTFASDIPIMYTSFDEIHDGKDRWEEDGGKTLHMYTCHGVSGGYGRWIVLAVLV